MAEHYYKYPLPEDTVAEERRKKNPFPTVLIDGVEYDVVGGPMDWALTAKRSCAACLGRGRIMYRLLGVTKRPALVQCHCSAKRYENGKHVVEALVAAFAALQGA